MVVRVEQLVALAAQVALQVLVVKQTLVALLG
jgi:hypothetical protein